MSHAGQSLQEANDFMRLEAPLLALLAQATAGMSPAVRLFTAAELAQVKDAAQHTPAVHLIYSGYQVAEAAGTQWRLLHKWFAVAAVRNVAAVRSGQAARRDAGQLAAIVAGCLAGAQVAGATRALELLTPPPAHYADGFQYIPVAVQAETIFRKP